MLKTFKDILIIKNGKNQKSVENPEGQYPIYGSGGIIGFANNYLCEGNTVVIGRKGSINNPIFVDKPFWNVDTAFGLVTDRSKMIPKYLYYFCLHFDFNRLNKAVTLPSLTKSDLLKIEIDVPDLVVQFKVVDKLQKVELIINLKKQQLQKFDDLIRARFVEMFGDIKSNSKKWEQVYLKDISYLISGGTPSRAKPEYFEGEIPWISTVALGKTEIGFEDAIEYITKDAIENSATKLIPANSLLFGIRVGVGKVSKNVVPMCTNQDIVSITNIDDNFNLVFLKYLLDEYLDFFNGQKRGATIQGIKSETLKNILVPKVNLKLQNDFEQFVNQVDKSKLAVQQSLDKTQELFDSLMQKYFG
ncbi:restriction endonuclease subunit S [Holdemania filiformis]|uniref:Type I restriction modification DNA specificity domain protein n=1 Tax=Holdemania filiformis DSM 12042 TaxID=545696 RepID=B9Y4K4_9FIRM|nr:restriction endonuclease subunit S [Holdemania filiformis]EEF69074.1 type I restriction modification DNA specificity domain protein [Holdemania filiformis DSM 12042]